MAEDRVTSKFHVMKLDCISRKMHILGTFHEYEFASTFMQKYIDKTFKLDNYLECYHKNKNECMINEYYYLFPMKTIFTIEIIEYTDV